MSSPGASRAVAPDRVGAREPTRPLCDPVVTQTVARINKAIAIDGGNTSHGQTGREKSNGSRNASFSIAPQPVALPAPRLRIAMVASAKTAYRFGWPAESTRGER